jgi:hypothetical protein
VQIHNAGRWEFVVVPFAQLDMNERSV